MSENRHAVPARRPRPLLAIAALLTLCGGLMACTATPAPYRTPTPAAASAMPPDADTELAAGTYLIAGMPVPFEVTVPAGWTYDAGGGLLDGPDAFLKFDVANYVAADACGWTLPLTAVGPAVEDFAEGLASAASITTTSPEAVEVDGYRGVEFDIAVEEGVDIDDCRHGHVCIHSIVETDCLRYYHEGVDQRETMRVMDLDGQRFLMTVGQWTKEIDPARLESARAVFDSISFDTE